MKPRLRKITGIWRCACFWPMNYVGLGFTAKESYADWRRHYEKHAHEVCA